MLIRVKSPPEELSEIYAREQVMEDMRKSVETFLAERCEDRMDLVHELSHELSELTWHYDQICLRLKKYEPDFIPMARTSYDPNERKVTLQ